MKVLVTGLRGFPNIQGGIEKHCEELYPRIQLLGCDINITVVRRKGFIQENPPLKEYINITFKDIKSPKIAGLEAVIHTLRAVWYAYKIKADIIHIHAIGPALVVPIAKVLGLKVIVTGRIQTGSYTNKDGQRVYTTDVVVEEQEFAESKSAASGETAAYTPSRPEPSAAAGDGFMNIPDGVEDEGLPFN